jgi:hypothetical protein
MALRVEHQTSVPLMATPAQKRFAQLSSTLAGMLTRRRRGWRRRHGGSALNPPSVDGGKFGQT